MPPSQAQNPCIFGHVVWTTKIGWLPYGTRTRSPSANATLKLVDPFACMRPSKQAAEPNSVANTKQCKSEKHCWFFNVYRKNVTASRWYDMTCSQVYALDHYLVFFLFYCSISQNPINLWDYRVYFLRHIYTCCLQTFLWWYIYKAEYIYIL